ncbi:MAG: pilus assembly protein TadG-related protein [Pirellulales bacterium]
MGLIRSAPPKRRKRENKPASCKRRRGTALVLLTLLMIPLLAMVAFSVDYGYLLKVDCDLQRCADAAALACVQDLVPAADGTQDLARVRATLRNYVAMNLDPSFQVLDADIEIGRFNPATIYSNVTLLNSGIFDAVRVKLRHDASANSRVALFIGPLLGMQDAAVTATATAVLQKPLGLLPGAKVIPFAVPKDVWDGRDTGEQWTIYGDGKMTDDSGVVIPGNWGTLDIGPTDNSTDALNDQITNGLKQSDIDALYADNRISTTTYIDTSHTISMQGDTGISIGLKLSVVPIHGETRIVPIFDSNSGAPGNNLEYNVVKWGVVTVIDSNWQGAKNTNIVIEKSYDYQGELRPADLSSTTGYVEGAFTSPVLVE